MIQYAEEFKKLAPKMNEIHTKYSDLANMKDLPEKIKQSQVKAEQTGTQLTSSFMKTMQYMGDPEVAVAQERMAIEEITERKIGEELLLEKEKLQGY